MRIGSGSDAASIQKLPGAEAVVFPNEARAAGLTPRQSVEALLARAGQAGWLGHVEQAEGLVGDAQRAAAKAGIAIEPAVVDEVRARAKKYAIEAPMLTAEHSAAMGDLESVRTHVAKAKQAAAAQGKPRAFDEGRATAAIERATALAFEVTIDKANDAAKRGDVSTLKTAIDTATALQPAKVPREWGEGGALIIRRAKAQFVQGRVHAATAFAAKGDVEATRRANDDARKMSRDIGEPISETTLELVLTGAYKNALSSAWLKAETAAEKSGPRATAQAIKEVRALAKDAGLHFDEGKAKKIEAKAPKPVAR